MLAAAIPSSTTSRLTCPTLLLLRALSITAQLVGVVGSRIALIFLTGAASPILVLLLITSGCGAFSRRMGTSLVFISLSTATIFILALVLGWSRAWYIQ